MFHFILATAGHVDHGKSSLVKALTGIDPDRLPEEKARGITIDLGFAHLELTHPDVPRTVFQVGIVDVPGHEDFVKNMVAGVGSIDLALLVVAADDGWMPQTEEHLQILTYLGVTRGVVALTKIDLIGSDEETSLRSVRAELAGTALANAPVIPCSVVSGRGISELKVALAQVLAETPPSRDIGKPRLPIDRAFVVRGIGTVITGTLIGGRFQRGQTVVIQPSGELARIRTVQSHGQDLDSVGPGSRAALSLVDVAVASKAGTDRNGVRRGQVVTLAEFGRPADTLDVLLERSPRLGTRHGGTARALKDGALLRFHHGSGNTPARLLLLEAREVAPGQKTIAQLRLDSLVFAFAGDRFILRDWAEQATLAGGIILDADASRKHFRNSNQVSLLRQRAECPADPMVALESILRRDRVLRRDALLVKSNFSSAEIADAATQLATAGKAFLAADLIAEASWWHALRMKAITLTDSYHLAHPEQPGLPLNQLRSALEDELIVPGTFELLLQASCDAGLIQAGTAIKRRDHRPALPVHLQAAGAQLRAVLAARPLDPPSRKELAPNPAAQQALRFLLQTGEAVELSPDVVLLAENYAKAVDAIQRHFQERTSATVSELRQAVGASRRIVVPLLEKLDREGLTRREGDVRVLRRDRLG